ncbi:BQ2448_136 [Microbotryum intermedium]|uniref:BQ2448_136 protein n=1 Tax=Microbotryum intermedium TaxID=269621 RepID=A0A238F4Q4_9BASI|nr:BQ2448_136 [Microbotryum intermedium]
MADSEHPKTKRAKRSNDARFPVASNPPLIARIKRLIQADEEIGKVAQATPVLVCPFKDPPRLSSQLRVLTTILSRSCKTTAKALELFLDQLVQELVKDSQARNVQKISAHTLKRVINTVPTFDFLSDLVQHVPDPIQAEEADGSNEGEKKPRTAATSAVATGSRSSGRKGKAVARLGDYATGEEGSGDEYGVGRGKEEEEDEYDE